MPFPHFFLSNSPHSYFLVLSVSYFLSSLFHNPTKSSTPANFITSHTPQLDHVPLQHPTKLISTIINTGHLLTHTCTSKQRNFTYTHLDSCIHIHIHACIKSDDPKIIKDLHENQGNISVFFSDMKEPMSCWTSTIATWSHWQTNGKMWYFRKQNSVKSEKPENFQAISRI